MFRLLWDYHNHNFDGHHDYQDQDDDERVDMSRHHHYHHHRHHHDHHHDHHHHRHHRHERVDVSRPVAGRGNVGWRPCREEDNWIYCHHHHHRQFISTRSLGASPGPDFYLEALRASWLHPLRPSRPQAGTSGPLKVRSSENRAICF